MLRNIQVLVAAADPAVRQSVSAGLRKQRARVLLAASGQTALQMARSHHPDVVLLDIPLPGLGVCRELRRTSDVPVLLLAARAAEADRIRGLDLGADGYVIKPVSLGELVARIRAVLRRTGLRDGPAKASLVVVPDLRLDLETHAVLSGGQSIDLSPREFELLVFLMRHPREALSRAEILSQVWGPGFAGDPRTVDTHVKKLRSKLGAPVGKHIRTLWGVGYRFEVEPRRAE